MKKIGIFYAPIGSNTERVAQLLQKLIGSDKADLVPIRNKKAQDVSAYDNIIMGIPSLGKQVWDTDKPINGWDDFRPEFEKIDYDGKKIALFGLGDQIAYANHFVDSMGNIANRIISFGGELVGYVSTEGYDFKESIALTADETMFVGLPINEDHEAELTEQRLLNWIEQLKNEFN